MGAWDGSMAAAVTAGIPPLTHWHRIHLFVPSCADAAGKFSEGAERVAFQCTEVSLSCPMGFGLLAGCALVSGVYASSPCASWVPMLLPKHEHDTSCVDHGTGGDPGRPHGRCSGATPGHEADTLY
jgi:hypothetical protein